MVSGEETCSVTGVGAEELAIARLIGEVKGLGESDSHSAVMVDNDFAIELRAVILLENDVLECLNCCMGTGTIDFAQPVDDILDVVEIVLVVDASATAVGFTAERLEVVEPVDDSKGIGHSKRFEAADIALYKLLIT